MKMHVRPLFTIIARALEGSRLCSHPNKLTSSQRWQQLGSGPDQIKLYTDPDPERKRLTIIFHAIPERSGVISVIESKTNQVHTTRSWDFLEPGIVHPGGLAGNSYSDNDVIDVVIGVIDTGVWPESKMFNDFGLGPVPKRFKGECVTGERFTLANCNRKIIGARYYSQGFEAENGPLESHGELFFRSARDTDGHGTHTASTAAGKSAVNASYLGIATGTARGGAPGARLAIYKACWFNQCSDADLLAAFDDAARDGVDIISLSVGPTPPQHDFFNDAISIAAFHAFRKGVLVSASAGNSGLPGTVINVAPWILTVGASSIDRIFVSDVVLGNDKILKGQALNPLDLKGFYGVIPGSAAPLPTIPAANASFCKSNTLEPKLIAGKIVVCTIEKITENRTAKSEVVKEGGGVGMILVDPIAKDVGFQFVIPATVIGQEEALELQTYLSTEKNPVATIYPTSTILNVKPAPKMAVFSSAGPSIISPDVIKPDITAPGLNILAAWSPVATKGAAGRSVNFNIISGTSMSCPHVSGAAALVKANHPSWSAMAVKSALMTTATRLDNTKGSILRDPQGSSTSPFDLGSGHLNPLAAIDPGLVYDFDTKDIITFLCGSGATPEQLQNLTGEAICCKIGLVEAYNLNYPSIGVANLRGRVSVYRTVTNYGTSRSTYLPSVELPWGVQISIAPSKLKFSHIGEKQTFRVDLTVKKPSNGSFVFGSITWSDGKYQVFTPIAVNATSIY
ncbi:hypothetical protein AMTR_s00040p00151440 [Amborella trichopoda]|uniref:Subtilisin-like protease fibronectin type-III domain-containing protein n=1 Tax=Amborella trichopoda TaxID=13333 RepID=W1PZQ0_AMBTC|nr:hypothetical protein AMTR_s00040p00151440 [Amborella trichopoda]